MLKSESSAPWVPRRVGEPLSKWEDSPHNLLLNRGAAPSSACPAVSSYDIQPGQKMMCNLSKCWETHTHTHTGTNTHTRKLLHSFLHSFPVMEGFCASRPQGDCSADLLFGKRGISGGKVTEAFTSFFIS